MTTTFDAIVIGLGAAGSAATYQLAKKGKKILGIDRFSPPHSFGSSHGDTRLVRQAVGEGEPYSRLSLRSYEIWRTIEKELNEQLLVVTGGLFIANKNQTGTHHGVGNFLESTISQSEKYHIKHEVLDAPAIRKRFPQFNINNEDIAYYEYEAGLLKPEACIKANLMLAEKYGAEIHTDEAVESFQEENGVATATTNRGIYSAERIIVTTGAWLPKLLDGDFAKLFTVARQVMYWFDAKDSIDQFLPKNFPVFIWRLEAAEQGFYGFPAMDGPQGGVKIGANQYKTTTTADTIDRNVTNDEKLSMYEHYVKSRFPGLSGKCIQAVACMYTLTPDFNFVIDQHPQYPSIIIACPCAGHGFKHSAAIGEALMEMVIRGKSTIGVEKFQLERFSK